MEQIHTLLQGTLEARGKVLVKLNVEEPNLDKVLAVLPAMRAPTISELSGGGAFALEAAVAKDGINTLIPALRDNGATDMVAAMRAYKEVGFDGPMRPDHVPQLAGEEDGEPGYTMLGRLFAFGYMRGLMQAVERI